MTDFERVVRGALDNALSNGYDFREDDPTLVAFDVMEYDADVPTLVAFDVMEYDADVPPLMTHHTVDQLKSVIRKWQADK